MTLTHIYSITVMGIFLLIYAFLFMHTFSGTQLGIKLNGLVYLEVSLNISL